jgi:hypothetical protein
MSIGSYIALLVTLGGPVPLSAAAANWSDPRGKRGLAHRALVASLTWTNLQVAMVMSILSLGILHFWSMLVAELVLGALGIWLYRRSPRRGYLLRRTSASLAWVGGAAAPLVALVAWRVLTRPVVEFDSLHYHMPQLAEWLQAGSLVRMRHVGSAFHTYAFGWEALAAVFVVPLGRGTLVSAPSLLAWLMYAAATHALARRMGARSAAAALGSLMLLCLPITRIGVATLQVDLAFGAFFIMGVYFALCYAEDRAPADLGAFIAASASMFWVKLSALPYVAGALGILAFLPALAFYGRNWLELGNPLGYLHLPPLFDGDVMGTAYWRKTTLLAVFDVRSSSHLVVLKDVAIAGLGIPGLVTGAFGIVALSQVWKRRRLALLIALFPVTFFLYIATPYSADNQPPFEVTPFMGQALRYGFAWIGIVAALGAVGMSVLTHRAIAALAIGVSGYVVIRSVGGSLELLGASFAGLLVFLVGRRLRKLPSEIHRDWLLAIAAGLVGTFLILRIATPLRMAHRVIAYGPVAAHLDAHAERDEALAFLYPNQRGNAHPVYPLYGPRLSRRIDILPTSETRPLDFLDERSLRWFVVGHPARLQGFLDMPGLRGVAFDPGRGWVLFERDDP